MLLLLLLSKCEKLQSLKQTIHATKHLKTNKYCMVKTPKAICSVRFGKQPHSHLSIELNHQFTTNSHNVQFKLSCKRFGQQSWHSFGLISGVPLIVCAAHLQRPVCSTFPVPSKVRTHVNFPQNEPRKIAMWYPVEAVEKVCPPHRQDYGRSRCSHQIKQRGS